MEMGHIESHYPTVMSTLIYRLATSDSLLNLIAEDRDDQENWVRIDTIALQVRKACELLLLGSTLAHFADGNGIDLTHWHPKDSFREISKFNDYPLQLPLEPELKIVDNVKQFVPASKPIPYAVLSSIYGQCGNILHVPTASKVLEEKVPSFQWEKYRSWVDGFTQLLRGHLLLLPEIKTVLVFTWSGNPQEAPHSFLMAGAGEAILQTDGLREFDLLAP
jgi:hypothetical protein